MSGSALNFEIFKATLDSFSGAATVERESMAPDHYPEFFFRQALSIFGSGFLIAKIGLDVIGYVLVGRSSYQNFKGEVYSLVVRENERRQGVANALMLDAIRWARVANLRMLSLSVSPLNVAAQSLYERLGFVPDSIKEHYYGQGEHRLLMNLDLNSGGANASAG